MMNERNVKMDQHIKKKEEEVNLFIEKMKGMIEKEKEEIQRVITVTDEILREPVDIMVKREKGVVEYLLNEVMDEVNIADEDAIKQKINRTLEKNVIGEWKENTQYMKDVFK